MDSNIGFGDEAICLSTPALLARSKQAKKNASKLSREFRRNFKRTHALTGKYRELMARIVKSGTSAGNESASFSASKKKATTQKRRARTNVVTISHLLAQSRADGFASHAVHDKQVVSAQLLTFPGNRIHNWIPVVRRNPSTLLPLLGTPGADANFRSHLDGGFPAAEHLVERLHGTVIRLDNMSSQGETACPVTVRLPDRTMCPMGKASTPAQFKKDFCKRLAAARLVKGLSQPEFALKLGLLPNTYSKYEKRSLLPHHLIPRAVDILEVTERFLFTGEPFEHRQVQRTLPAAASSEAASAEVSAEQRSQVRGRA